MTFFGEKCLLGILVLGVVSTTSLKAQNRTNIFRKPRGTVANPASAPDALAAYQERARGAAPPLPTVPVGTAAPVVQGPLTAPAAAVAQVLQALPSAPPSTPQTPGSTASAATPAPPNCAQIPALGSLSGLATMAGPLLGAAGNTGALSGGLAPLVQSMLNNPQGQGFIQGILGQMNLPCVPSNPAQLLQEVLASGTTAGSAPSASCPIPPAAPLSSLATGGRAVEDQLRSLMGVYRSMACGGTTGPLVRMLTQGLEGNGLKPAQLAAQMELIERQLIPWAQTMVSCSSQFAPLLQAARIQLPTAEELDQLRAQLAAVRPFVTVLGGLPFIQDARVRCQANCVAPATPTACAVQLPGSTQWATVMEASGSSQCASAAPGSNAPTTAPAATRAHDTSAPSAQ